MSINSKVMTTVPVRQKRKLITRKTTIQPPDPKVSTVKIMKKKINIQKRSKSRKMQVSLLRTTWNKLALSLVN